MAIYKTAIEKPVTTALIFIAVIIIGIDDDLPGSVRVRDRDERHQVHGERPHLGGPPEAYHIAVQG